MRKWLTERMTDQPAAQSTTLVEVDLWGDLVCPWSWIAKRRVEHAVASFERPHDVTVRLRSFELDPDVQAFVERLERAADEESGRPDPGSLPSGDVIAREFQRFLRQRGNDA